jgi:hypothetical protein
LNLESPEYEAGVLTTQPHCSALTDILLIGIYCDIVTVHTAGSLKMDLFGTNTVAITNTIIINYPRLLRQKTLEQYRW